MSDSEGDSRTAAVGRKRNAAGEYKSLPDSRRPSASSKESGEVSSSSDSDDDNDDDDDGSAEESDSDIEEINADQWSKRQKTGAASEEDQQVSSDRSMDTDSSSDDSSVIEIPQPSKHSDTSTTRIADLAPRDREAQHKYFNITSSAAAVRCLSCGERGHMASACSARTCSHCHQRDLHASSACPTYRKCGLCRERGHDARLCRNRAFRGPDPCDVCAQSSHIEEECPYLWRISTKDVSRQDGREASAGRRHAPDALNYDDDDEDDSPPPPPPPPPGREQRQPWQLMGLFDDGRD